MAHKGETWNESQVYKDAWTLRQVRQVTRRGIYNSIPTYHTNVGFTEDGEFLIFGSAREGHSAIFRCHVPTGDITQLIDPVPGVGAYWEWHKMGACPGNGMGITMMMSIAPRSRWAVFMAGRSLRAVQIETLAEHTLIDDIGAEWIEGVPSIDPAETHVLLPLMPAHPDLVAGKRMSLPYLDYFASGEGMRTRLLQVPLAGGPVEVSHEEMGVGGAHCPHSPVDPNLILLDRDFPPRYWAGSDGKTNRIWIYNLATTQLTELPPQDNARFQVHCAWTWDGQGVVYHGGSTKGGYFIGVVDKSGHTVREYHFKDAGSYGHVSAMAGRPAIILDGNITNDMLLWLYYDAEQPRVEAIARHGTAWGALPGQYTHPHPICDPAGRWIAYNVGHAGRSDVYVVGV